MKGTSHKDIFSRLKANRVVSNSVPPSWKFFFIMLFLKAAEAQFAQNMMIQSNSSNAEFDYLVSLDNWTIPQFNNLQYIQNNSSSMLAYVVDSTIKAFCNVANARSMSNFNSTEYQLIKPFYQQINDPDDGSEDYVVARLYRHNNATTNTNFENSMSSLILTILSDYSETSLSSLFIVAIVFGGIALFAACCAIVGYVTHKMTAAVPAPALAAAPFIGPAPPPVPPVLDIENQPLLVGNPSLDYDDETEDRADTSFSAR